jgi:uncharacterized protein YjlB
MGGGRGAQGGAFRMQAAFVMSANARKHGFLPVEDIYRSRHPTINLSRISDCFYTNIISSRWLMISFLNHYYHTELEEILVNMFF